jgi:ferrochelatase
MRYSAPGVEAALQTLAAQQAQRIVAVSLYPHYSFTTSLSALEQVEQHLPDTMAWTPVKAFGTHPGWIRALTEALTARWHELRPGLSARVVFTAHSLPLRYLRRGDPYVAQVRATVASVQQAMPLPLHCLLAFQSQVGPLAWQGPSLEKILAAMVRDKVRQVIVCPVSFVTENLETLYDLDVVFQQQCLRAGLKHFFRVTTVGASETFRIALAEIIQAAAAPWQGLKSKTVRSRTQRRPPCLM